LALSSPASAQIDVYSANDYSPRGNVTLPLRGPAIFVDMAACCFCKCLYLADAYGRRIVRLNMPPKLHEWRVDDIGYGAVISVTSSHDVLVMCDKSNKLKLFSTDGLLRMIVDLQPDIVHMTSAIELMPGLLPGHTRQRFRQPSPSLSGKQRGQNSPCIRINSQQIAGLSEGCCR